MLAVRQDSLGHIQYILKSDLRWIPWYELYLNNKGNFERVEKGIRQIRSNGLPVWLVIFPEGTRYNLIKNQDVIEKTVWYQLEHFLL
jgi:lysophosphatidate acyltransferase